jgi:hypothetical protein
MDETRKVCLVHHPHYKIKTTLTLRVFSVFKEICLELLTDRFVRHFLDKKAWAVI